MDIDTFLSANKSMVIAPAGFGKTYTIAECIASYRGEKRVLVLTHTHAGIASLKEKFRLKNIPLSLHMFFIGINKQIKEYINTIYQCFIITASLDDRFSFSLNWVNFVTLFVSILLL